MTLFRRLFAYLRAHRYYTTTRPCRTCPCRALHTRVDRFNPFNTQQVEVETGETCPIGPANIAWYEDTAESFETMRIE